MRAAGPRLRALARAALWTLALVCVVALIGAALAAAGVFHLRARAERAMTERLGLDATLGSLSLSIGAPMSIAGAHLALRVPGHPELPPFIAIDAFRAEVGFDLLRGRIGRVDVRGLRITIPPSGERPSGAGLHAGGASPPGGRVVIAHLQATDTVLMLLPHDTARTRQIYAIHDLAMDDLGLDRQMPFRASLTIPIPRGLVQSRGRVGPWNRGDPIDLPVSGDYVFSRADLETIHGIGGTLTSTGSYSGELRRISVTGSTSSPNFNLDLGGQPMPLTTRFEALVDASDGTTKLRRVDATLGRTDMSVTGAIDNLPGPGRHLIDLDARVPHGRIEDILRLAHQGPPLIVGGVTLDAHVSLPPGPGRPRSRLKLDGRFALSGITFTDREVQARVQAFSQRGRGRKDAHLPPVQSRFDGRFRLDAGVLALPDLSFAVPGVGVRLAGTFTLGTRALDFAGTVRLRASLSKVVGGFKSLFLKPFNWIFRRKGAGTVVGIAVNGTMDKPAVHVRLAHRSPERRGAF